MKKYYVAFLLMLISQSFVFAQESDTSGTSITSEEEVKEKKNRETLIKETMGLDIDTANYFELVAWCKTLGLLDSGGRQDLQNRLRSYFDISPAAEGIKAAGRRIEIKSAKSSEYFSIEEVEENYILLQGQVVLVFTEEDNTTTHTIKAERILFNQSLNIISAEGNIEYIRKRGEEEEIFRGQSFIFDVKKWGGVFYRAKGEKEKEVEENKIIFFYTGETISRLDNETIILEDGMITSSKDVENPNYKITASKIWVFAPGEWAVQDAVLYLGRIPMLYVPFFFHAGDELFFHPVAGYRDREGYFMQTTTYFIGRKETKPSVFSFLQFEEKDVSGQPRQYEQVWRGLFLHNKRLITKKNGEQAGGETTVTSAIKTLKLYVDFYSRLGGFIGVFLDVDPVIKLRGGVGISRSIFLDTTGYTPFYNDEEYWNSGYFFGIELPFRFGLDTQFELSYGIIKKFSGNFELYSDPFFPTDFYDRSEDIDWEEVFGVEIKERSGVTVQSDDLSALERKNISWTLDSNIRFNDLFSTPYLTTLELKTFNFLFEWESKYVPNYGINPTASNPNRMFYYPKRVVFPNSTLSLGGTIFTIKDIEGVSTEQQPKTAPDPGLGMRTPFADLFEIESEDSAESIGIMLRVPEQQPDFTLKHTYERLNSTLTYSFNQNITMEYPFVGSQTVNSDPVSINDIDYETKYNSIKLDGDYWVTYNMGLWNNLIGLNVRLKLTERYKNFYDESDTLTSSEWDSLLQSAYQYTSFTTTKETTFTYKPFINNDLFNQTNITYKLFWDIYKYEFDEMDNSTPVYENNIFLWNKQKVSQHEVSATLVYKPFDESNFLRLTYDMPPTLGSIESELNFYIWIFHTIIISEYEQNALDDLWYFQPLSITEEIILKDYFMFKSILRYDIEGEQFKDLKTTVSLLPYEYDKKSMYLFTQILDFNFEEDTIERSQSTLKLWFFTAEYIARYMNPVNPLGRQLSTDKEFLPYKLTFNIDYGTGSLYFWKNRVNLETNITSALNIDLQQYVASDLTFTFQFVFYIHEFLNISLKTTTINDNVYRYIPGFPEAVSQAISDDYPATNVDIDWVNPLEDLWYSFCFWDEEARKRSFFKLKDVGITITHHLGDWDLSFSFEGSFKQELQTDGSTKYEWLPVISFKLKWYPIPEINTEIQYNEDEGLTF
ncbi:MAG: LPS-assembly protein LptD [Spirochaetales bacterium]|nr:LPS-assembly protein LptD [Spirochaetales bacterium]